MTKRKKKLVIALIITGVLTMIISYFNRLTFDESTQLRMSESPHYGEGCFHGEAVSTEDKDGDGGMMAFFFGKNKSERKPQAEVPRTQADLGHFASMESNHLSATWLGHSSLLVNMDGHRIITDPVFEEKITVVGPSRFNGELPVNPDDLPSVDFVVISHDHYDHLNKYSIQLLADKTQWFAVPLGVGTRLKRWGIDATQIVELDWWESFTVNDQLTLTATPAQHFSGRGILDRNKTLWSSWVIRSPQHRIFFSGDTGYFDGFKQIGDTYGPFDMTFIECGAYNRAWSNIHMFPEETVQAHMDVKGKVLHPIHWGTYNLATHPWDEPMERLDRAAREHNVQVSTPIVGETTVFGEDLHTSKWWQNVASAAKQAAGRIPALNPAME